MKLEQITNHTFKQKQSTFNRFLTGVSKRLFYVAVPMVLATGVADLLSSCGSEDNNEPQTYGCISDSECKVDRICVKGECVPSTNNNNNNNYTPEDDLYIPSDNDVYTSSNNDVSHSDVNFSPDSYSNYQDYYSQDVSSPLDLDGGGLPQSEICESYCDDGKCIPSWWVCDEIQDCKGNEDEKNCP